MMKLELMDSRSGSLRVYQGESVVDVDSEIGCEASVSGDGGFIFMFMFNTDT